MTIPSAKPSGASISKANGGSDLFLEDFIRKQSPETREAAEKAAEPWLTMIKASRS